MGGMFGGNRSNQSSVSIPQYQEPPFRGYSLFGYGTGRDDQGYFLNEGPQQLADRQAAEQVRRDLIRSLGLEGYGQQGNEYAQLIADQNLRYAQPRLENSLIQRGLGGSTVYRDALTQLIQGASEQGRLGAADLVRQNLASVSGNYLNPLYDFGRNLLALTGQTDLTRNAQAQQLYQAQLPFLSQVNAGQDTQGMLGNIIGAIGSMAQQQMGGKNTPSSASLPNSWQFASPQTGWGVASPRSNWANPF